MNSDRDLVRRHLDWFVPAARAAGDGTLWPSCLGHDGQRHDGSHAPAGVAKRCYRAIASPGGSNLYWDLPLVAAATAHAHGDAAAAYAGDYLDRCTARDDLPYWGNHAYFHFDHGVPVGFKGDEPPTPVTGDRFPYHELRPLVVDWDLLATWRSEAAMRAVAAMGRHHLVPEGGGDFNRHADARHDLAFLEAGAVLVDSLAWAGERGDEVSKQRAQDVFGFVRDHVDATTGLLPTTPGSRRWDGVTATSECGAWALACLRVARRQGDDWAAHGRAVLLAWQRASWDEDAGAFRGRVATADGSHRREPVPTPYQPGTWSDPWRATFPAHEHPWDAALACLELARRGDDEAGRDLERWRRSITASLPARGGLGGYAEHYGRAIHLARAAAGITGAAAWDELATTLRDEALAALWTGERFRSHPFEQRCDAVDGLGFLLLALGESPEEAAADPIAWPW